MQKFTLHEGYRLPTHVKLRNMVLQNNIKISKYKVRKVSESTYADTQTIWTNLLSTKLT
jgi:hypothetical protein